MTLSTEFTDQLQDLEAGLSQNYPMNDLLNDISAFTSVYEGLRNYRIFVSWIDNAEYENDKAMRKSMPCMIFTREIAAWKVGKSRTSNLPSTYERE